MLRRLAFGLLAAGLLLIAAPAFAQPPTNTTTHEKGLVETFVDVVPSCEPEGGPLYTITTTSNLVEHETVFDDGRVHATFTQTGKFSAVPLENPSLPSYTGRFTIWGDFNQNGTTVNGTFTFNLTWDGLRRIDDQQPPKRPLQRSAGWQCERVLQLPLANAFGSATRAGPGGAPRQQSYEEGGPAMRRIPERSQEQRESR